MAKRIYELAKELNVSSKDMVNAAETKGFSVKNHMSTMGANEERYLREYFGNKGNQGGAPKKASTKPAKVSATNTKPSKPMQKSADRPAKAASKRNVNVDNMDTKSTNENRPSRGNNNNSNNNRSNNRGGRNDWNNNGGNNRNNRHGKKGKRSFNNNHGPAKVLPQRKDQPLPEVLVYSIGMNVQDIAKLIHRDTAEIIKKLFMLGVMVNQNQSLDAETIEILAADYGIAAEEKIEVDVADTDKFFKEAQNNTENSTPRPPVVTIMGHVDHGKTTLLDYLRNSHVTEGEAGGITQHIGAYQVKADDRIITFLDTPGHAAFTAMRARGADVTDITILVVAADDGVMPQTIEAINHAKAAKTPIIVAVNKIDKPGANPENVMNQLMQYELIPEEFGGDTIFVKISAKFGQNVDELLEMILLQSDVLELTANPKQNGAGSVIEARLDKGRGPIATLLVQQGTLRVGDPIVVGNTYGRVRTMTNDRGRRIKEAGPSTPVEITGLNDVPDSGDLFIVFDDEKTARAAGEERAKRALLANRHRNNVVSVSDLFSKMADKEIKSVPVIIKADVQGSVEALAGSFRKIDVDGVKVDIVHTAVGAINESDITLAEASGAIIIGFNVRPTPQARQQADNEEVDIRLHNIIYNAIDEIEAAMKGQLEPEFEEKIIGNVEIRELFKVSKVGTIVGGMVMSGVIKRDSSIRLIRDSVVIYEGTLGSLKRFKDDVKEVKKGYDLGLTIENYNDEKVGDIIEVFEMVEVPRD
ncbi:translation initiation factor IF-2 [Periweissella fabalis]|uniref:Translation initiation factor IF-2 n=1 Tax=Periweissella fabalis TaxID=1070421 RepID=A0A7X6MZU9_9LACO|nr:translation initiation factor IF-2 [Periweissella fabalis]MCM0598938.1 translation initiation factor IF-2 [Periweissella fabalis]NKZ23218.1 translation initiation factor IF-2 [Periweissella fabalis]